MTEESRIRTYMLEVLSDHIDPLTGELELTPLAEDAMNEFGEQDTNDPELYFELAFEVGEQNGLLP